MLTVLVLGLCVGIVLGLTGAGGGILAVPALVFSQGWTVAQAAPIGLLAVTGAAMVGAGEGFYHKLVRYRETAVPSVVLTARQRDMLRCLRDGLDNQAIARRTGLSVKTIENHLTRLYRQINVQSRLEAANYLVHHPDALGNTEPGTSAAAPVHAASGAQLAILVVDDNLRYRTQMRRMLGKTCPAASIYEAENTRTALRVVADTQPQLVFVDVVLGDEHGIETARQIRTLSAATRIVLISAYPDREFHRLGLEAGAVAFLDKKDIDAAALRELVDDAIV